MQARKMILAGAMLLAMVMVSSASATVIEIALVGVGLNYNGTNLTDPNTTGPSSLASATFFLNEDPNPLGMDVTGVTLNLYIPGVINIPAIGGPVDMPSTLKGSLYLDLGGSEFLSLVLDSVTVSYTPMGSTLRFAGVTSSSTVAGQNLPYGLSFLNPVGITFTTQIRQLQLTTDGLYVSSFVSTGVGDIYRVPEPAAMSLLAIGALALILRRRKR